MKRNIHESILTPLILWLLVFAGSGAMWYALAYNPERLLYVERRQPAASYDYGEELRREGRYEEALRAYERGIAYFEGIYRDSGMERHLVQVARGLLGLAHIHMYHLGEEGLPEAERLYHEVIERYPHWAGGQPYYSLGIVQNRLGKYAEAEENLTRALERGHGRVEVELVYFHRGLARARQDLLDLAASDWYVFLRYAGRGIYPSEWEAIETAPLQNAGAPEALFIRGLLMERQGDNESAERILQHYLEEQPHDPAARFALARITDMGQPCLPQALAPSAVETKPPSAVGEIELARCFPFRDERPYPFLDTRVDLYLPESGVYEIAAHLSGRSPGADPPIVEALVNNNPRTEIIVRGSSPERYSITVELNAGRSILQLREKWPTGQPIQAELHLHHLSVQQQQEQMSHP